MDRNKLAKLLVAEFLLDTIVSGLAGERLPESLIFDHHPNTRANAMLVALESIDEARETLEDFKKNPCFDTEEEATDAFYNRVVPVYEHPSRY